jgi:DNA repair protein RecN (Recombination protein N)
MLTRLYIKQYALIEELTIEFESGLNIITGETGAGKSIIIDALGLILGARADADAVRKGAEKAVVEGMFSAAGNGKLTALLAAHELDPGDELILRREITVKGQSRAFVNDSPATLAVLREVGDLMVDLHGQHEHQSLLRPETHVDMVDGFGGLDGLVREFESAYHEARGSLRELQELRAREDQLREKRSLYEFQAAEIDAVSPRAGEEDALESELVILENAEKLFAATERLHQMLYEGENAVHDQLVIARNELENLATIDKAFEEHRAEAASAAAIVDEIAKFVQQYNSRIEFQPGRLDEIRDRLGHIALLKKKYGGSLDAVLAHREAVGRELSLAEHFEEEIEKLSRRIDGERARASEIAARLSAKRDDVGKKINSAVVKSLADLGIAHAQFETRISYRQSEDPAQAVIRVGREWRDASPKGMDHLEFYLSTNVGEDPKPLVKVASGGEISRVMLALKMILAKSDRLPLLVFDEIDVGVSGRVAQAVGRSMKKLSQFHQVIAITHLPQIAGLADCHVVVEKVEEKKRSFTRVRKLALDERVAEVAKLMSGDEVTGSALSSARELMGLRG